MRPKEKLNDNIKNYLTYKVVLTMKKTKSSLTIAFITNDPDGWFIDKLTYMTKSGKLNDKSTIIAKDLPSFMSFYESAGFYKV